MTIQQDTIVGLLQGIEWFASLDGAELERLAEGAATVRLAGGDTIFEEGDPGDGCFVVHSGSVKVLRKFPDGRRLTLARLGPGNIFGELALFNGERRSATVQAAEESVVVGLGADNVMEILRQNPDASLGMALMLADRLRAANERLFDYAVATVSGRVAATLLAQVEARQAQGAGDRDVEVVGSTADLARLAGGDRDSATRVLNWLEQEGVLTLERGKTIVHDPSALAKYLG